MITSKLKSTRKLVWKISGQQETFLSQDYRSGFYLNKTSE